MGAALAVQDPRVIDGDQALHSSSSYRRVCSLVSTSNAIPTSPRVVLNMHNVMSRDSLDIVDQIESGWFEPTAILDPRSVEFAHSSLPRHSLTQKQQFAGRRQTGSPATSVRRTDGIPSTQCNLDPGHRNPEGDIVLPRTDGRPNDTRLGFGDTPSRRVSFHLVIGVG